VVESGRKWSIFETSNFNYKMTAFIGEFECKIDPKGRLMLPVSLRKQIPNEADEKFIVNRGFEKHLNLYPLNEWKKTTNKLNKLNLFVKKNREFLRRFNNGASESEIDNTGRILIGKNLLDYASIDKEVVLVAYANRIEVWNKADYQNMLSDDSIDFADLAEDVMGGIDDEIIQED
jgi:MraZ protein